MFSCEDCAAHNQGHVSLFSEPVLPSHHTYWFRSVLAHIIHGINLHSLYCTVNGCHYPFRALLHVYVYCISHKRSAVWNSDYEFQPVGRYGGLICRNVDAFARLGITAAKLGFVFQVRGRNREGKILVQLDYVSTFSNPQDWFRVASGAACLCLDGSNQPQLYSIAGVSREIISVDAAILRMRLSGPIDWLRLVARYSGPSSGMAGTIAGKRTSVIYVADYFWHMAHGYQTPIQDVGCLEHHVDLLLGKLDPLLESRALVLDETDIVDLPAYQRYLIEVGLAHDEDDFLPAVPYNSDEDEILDSDEEQ